MQVLHCYGVHQDLVDEMEGTIPNLYSKQGLSAVKELDDFTNDKKHQLILVDDLMHKVMRNKDMEQLIMQGCHHRFVSCHY